MPSLTAARRRLHADGGFTLVELLVVLIILGILVLIAVSSYLGFRERAANAAARANLRAAIPAAEAYYSTGSTYVGMDATALRAIDGGLSPSLTVVSVTDTSFCLTDEVSGSRWSVFGPGPRVPVDYYNNGTCT
jgi:type IV pilus assembly protein PilA